jgi:ribonuclease BN (tRNA processing enzyme)
MQVPTSRRVLRFVRFSAVTLLFASLPAMMSSSQKSPSSTTQVVLLGTGTPGWDPDSSGPSTAIVVNGTPYLVDFGPGVVRRAGAAYNKGVKALYPPNIRVAFLTHRHVDHTVGYADLIFSPAQAFGNRTEPLEVYGPQGTVAMTEYILKAHKLNPEDQRYRVNAHEIKPGVVYKDANVTVKAFAVQHGNVEAFGFRFETPDRAIVISGDTTPTQSVVENCDACDVLIHEAYSLATFNAVPPDAQGQRKKLHTSSQELAELAKKARPALLVVYHRSNLGGRGVVNSDDVLLDEIRSMYGGRVVIGRDLDVY